MLEKIGVFFLSVLASFNIIITPTPIPTPTTQPNLDENRLWNLVNDWEKKQGYDAFVRNDELCNAADYFMAYSSDWTYSWFTNAFNKDYPVSIKYPHSKIEVNYAKEFTNENDILNYWIDSIATKKRLTDYSEYSCIKCNKNNCLQIFANITSQKTNNTNTNTNITESTNSDPNVNCLIHEKCGGGSKLVKKSVCDNSICCQYPDRAVFYLDRSQCASSNKNQNNQQGSSKVRCSYSGGGYQFDFGELTYSECSVKSTEYWAQQGKTSNNIPIQPTVAINPTSPSSNTTSTINTSNCYSQYNSDTQRANSYGGNVGSVMKEMAQTNLNRCLSTGTVTAVGTVQQDSRPKDRDGKLCSEYGPELQGYSKEMGCP